MLGHTAHTEIDTSQTNTLVYKPKNEWIKKKVEENGEKLMCKNCIETKA